MNGIILIWLLICVLACGARHISDENRHSVHRNDEEKRGQRQQLLNHSRLEKKLVASSSRDSAEESVRSNELNDGFDEYPVNFICKFKETTNERNLEKA